MAWAERLGPELNRCPAYGQNLGYLWKAGADRPPRVGSLLWFAVVGVVVVMVDLSLSSFIAINPRLELLQRLPDATRLALWFRTIAAPGTLIVVIRGAGNMYGAASKTWNKKYSSVKTYRVVDQPIFQVKRETCVHLEGGRSGDQENLSLCCGAVSTGTGCWGSASGELCAESTNTAWKAKLEGVNVEDVETVRWGGGEEDGHVINNGDSNMPSYILTDSTFNATVPRSVLTLFCGRSGRGDMHRCYIEHESLNSWTGCMKLMRFDNPSDHRHKSVLRSGLRRIVLTEEHEAERNPRTRKKKFEQTLPNKTTAVTPCTGADHRHESVLYPVHGGLGWLAQCAGRPLRVGRTIRVGVKYTSIERRGWTRGGAVGAGPGDVGNVRNWKLNSNFEGGRVVVWPSLLAFSLRIKAKLERSRTEPMVSRQGKADGHAAREQVRPVRYESLYVLYFNPGWRYREDLFWGRFCPWPTETADRDSDSTTGKAV
ncbi:hypothetical protein B0H14DRAFT_2587169 [Mycena olivaceomarginata]|nr:hypothetical protein B0H14DRAFT_2587169 [Mycena olivaceomarginata]